MSVIVQSGVKADTVTTPVTLSSPQAYNLTARLSGRTIRLPNLKKHLVGWPNDTSEHLPEVRPQVEQMTER